MRVQRFAWTALAVAVLAPTAAFAQEPPPPAGGEQQDDAVVKAGEVTVTLEEAGAEPRRALRLTPDKGAARMAETTMRMTMSQSMGGMDMPEQTLPPTRTTMRTEVAEVSDAGEITWSFEVTEAEVLDAEGADQMMVQAMRDAIKATVGATGRAVFTDRGAFRNIKTTAPEGANPAIQGQLDELGQQMSQMTAVLPEEPVGEGARWTVATTLETNGIKIEQTTTYRVLALNEGRAELEFTVQQSATDQQMNAPGLPPGATATIEELSSDGKGRMVVSFDQLVADEMTMELTSEMDIAVAMQGQTQNVTQGTEMKVELKARPVEDADTDDGDDGGNA